MNIVDSRLCDVEPQFRERVVQRIAAVEEYLVTPTRNKAIEVGARVGLKSQQIYYLAMAWKARRDPRDLVGRGRRLSARPGNDQRQREVVRDVLRERSKGGKHRNLAKAIREHGKALRIVMPTDTAIYDLVRQVGGELADANEPADYSVDVVVIDLPVEHSAGPVRPHMVTVTNIDSMTLAGAAFSIEPPTAVDFARALTNALDNAGNRRTASRRSKPVCIQLPKTKLVDLDVIANVLEQDGVDVIWRTGSLRSPMLGPRQMAGNASFALGPLFLKRRVRTMLAFTTLDKRKADPVLGPPVPVREAEAFVQHAIRRAANDNTLTGLRAVPEEALRTLERETKFAHQAN